MKPEAERLGEPVVVAGEIPEQHAGNDHVVEVGDEKRGVVQVVVNRNDRVHHAG